MEKLAYVTASLSIVILAVIAWLIHRDGTELDELLYFALASAAAVVWNITTFAGVILDKLDES